MTAVSGLTGSPSRCCFQIPVRSSGSLCGRVSNFPHSWKPAGKNELLLGERSYWTGFTQRLNARKTHLLKFAMDASYGDIPNEPTGKASYGDIPNEPTAIFPRINVRDPYKRLGISREASEDEIQGARNFLIRQYAGHKPSVDAIESAHDKIIMQQFYDRKNPKIDFKKKVREVHQSRIVQAVRNRFRTPSTKFIIKTSIAFVVLGALTVLFPTEEGPTLQVAISLLATIYFVYDRLKSKLRAVLYSAGAFVFSWLVGTFLMVSVIPPILKGPRSFEVTTSLITYVLLWVSSTYLK
ncbi:PREDICTED: protein CHAPERONE-LIKE PROTEIN OF POR1, chloroplastic isoform X1 [Prunus mume]|uniref:Protein CHAPERONE-LIKE PROTEIN OF POR1, chloroplastic isoform X1 n=1 Tax=Prunus mume TaxID=102107 RepID=A0ABM0PMN2_PRUMU|nr:PREDICTED: protein CHAPERONE-LIKE PROTEIN OF POR1, chloroplastic isoform X1 [Prunus mume]